MSPLFCMIFVLLFCNTAIGSLQELSPTVRLHQLDNFCIKFQDAQKLFVLDPGDTNTFFEVGLHNLQKLEYCLRKVTKKCTTPDDSNFAQSVKHTLIRCITKQIQLAEIYTPHDHKMLHTNSAPNLKLNYDTFKK